MSSAKRPHTDSPSRSPSPSRTPKAQRVAASARPPLLCSLPPTCNPPHNAPTPLAGTRALEAHYATHHAHVCSAEGCGSVFPDPRLLELHLTECHDPLAELRKERGEKIFACHLESCPRVFASPKARRMHLITVHHYPKQYFFAVTNRGIGEMLRRWGEGASLLRGPWRARDDAGSDEDSDNPPEDPGSVEDDARTPVPQPKPGPHIEPTGENAKGGLDADIDALAHDVSALKLVPSSVRFGRGGARAAGLATRSGRPAGRHHPAAPTHAPPTKPKAPEQEDEREQDIDVMDEDAVEAPRGRGRGRRGSHGRGRGRGFVPPPPRAGFLLRGGAGRMRGVPRGLQMAAVRARGRGAAV
ncbi:hypothetical protein BC834DRAFT_891962 [Gloeopeniophorella convolvens]|nr:hypothetical protein BC834DRAFT_891962 [Gloeopeniophorella convolvens]